MTTDLPAFRSRTAAQAQELIDSIALAEAIIVETIERECEALREQRLLAANALHARVCDAARLYLQSAHTAQARMATLERALPGCLDLLEDRRAAFAPVLRIHLAVLSAQRAAAEEGSEAGPTVGRSAPPQRAQQNVAPRIMPAPRAPVDRPSASPRRRTA